MAQLMPLPHTVSCFSKIQIGFLSFWYRLTRVVPGKGPLNVCVCVLFNIFLYVCFFVQLRVCVHCQKTGRSDVAKFFFSNAVVRNRICC